MSEMPNESAQDLLAAVVDGEPAAWDEIVSRYRGLIMHTATRIGLSSSDAADVAQLTWMRLWQHGHQIRNPDRLAGWLVRTAHREAIKIATAATRQVPCADLAADHGRPSLGAVHDVYPVEQEYDWAVEQALGRLPARYRLLLRLLASELCLSYREIASRMGVPIGSIGPMRMRAIRMLEKTPEFASREFPRPVLSGIAS
jgi:RNA polymerase sigma factor (sigma-70 family)